MALFSERVFFSPSLVINPNGSSSLNCCPLSASRKILCPFVISDGFILQIEKGRWFFRRHLFQVLHNGESTYQKSTRISASVWKSLPEVSEARCFDAPSKTQTLKAEHWSRSLFRPCSRSSQLTPVGFGAPALGTEHTKDSSPARAQMQVFSWLEIAALPLSPSGNSTKNQSLLPCHPHGERLESMGSVWGSFKPAVASEKNPFLIPATRLARK